MKTIFITALLLLATSMSVAQLSVDRQVIGNAGVKLQNGSLSMDYTLGESWVTVLNSNNLALQQGFHQGYAGPAASLENGFNEGMLLLYPQPADDFLSIRFEEAPQTRLHLRFYNMMGQLIIPANAELGPTQDQIQIPVQDWSTGAYLIQVLSADGELLYQQKWLKS